MTWDFASRMRYGRRRAAIRAGVCADDELDRAFAVTFVGGVAEQVEDTKCGSDDSVVRALEQAPWEVMGGGR